MMFKRLLCGLLCALMLLMLIPTVLAAQTQTVRVEEMGMTISIPDGCDYFSIDLPADSPNWDILDRADFMQDYKDLGLYFLAFPSGAQWAFHASRHEYYAPDFHLLSDKACLSDIKEYYIGDHNELLTEPEIYRTEQAVYVTYSYKWESEDGVPSYGRSYVTVINGALHQFDTNSDYPHTPEEEALIRDMVTSVTFDQPPEPSPKTTDTAMNQQGLSFSLPAAYSYKNPELPDDHHCWINWDKRDFMEWIDGTDICFYADDGSTEMTVFVMDADIIQDWNDGLPSINREIGERALENLLASELLSPAELFDHPQTSFVSGICYNQYGYCTEAFYTIFNGRDYLFVFTSDEPLSAARDREYHTIMENVRFFNAALTPPVDPEHTHIEDDKTGVALDAPEHWSLKDSNYVNNQASFGLLLDLELTPDFGNIGIIHCTRYPISDLTDPEPEFPDDPASVAAALLSNISGTAVQPEDLGQLTLKGTVYYRWVPEAENVLGVTEYLVIQRDDQIYSFFTTLPLDSEFHDEFREIMKTVEFIPIVFQGAVNGTASTAEAPASEAVVNLRTVLIVVLILLVLALAALILLALRKPKKASPTPIVTPQTDSIDFCPYCGAKLHEPYQFCSHCGRQILL